MKPTVLDLGLQIAGMAVMIAVTAFLCLRWEAMPAEVPTHFNAAGAADEFGNKSSVLVLLVIAWLVYVMVAGLTFVPRLLNANANPRAAQSARRMLEGLGLVIALDFGYIILCCILGRNLGLWFLPVFLVLTFGATSAGAVMAFRNR